MLYQSVGGGDDDRKRPVSAANDNMLSRGQSDVNYIDVSLIVSLDTTLVARVAYADYDTAVTTDNDVSINGNCWLGR